MAVAEEEEDWNFDEEQVRKELEAGQLRTARAQELLASQEAVLKRSQTKIRESDEQAQGASPSTPVRMRRTEQGMSWLTTPEKPGTSDRARSAAQVSKQMAKRKERSNIVSARQERMAEEERDYQMRVYNGIEAVEARIQKMQEDFFEEQRRKAFTAQQRRNAQQKAIKEFRREEERLYEAYYSKRSSSQSPRPSRNSSPSRSRSPHPSAQDPSQALVTEPGEELYQTILKSHIKYAGTIDKWQQFVQENDRRAEAYRRRVLLPRGKSSPKGGKLALGLPDEVMALFAPPADMCRSLTASPTGLSTIDSFWSGTGPAETDVEGATPKAQDCSSEYGDMGREGYLSPGTAASRTSSPKSRSRRLWSRARQLVLGQLGIARKMSPQVWEDRQRRIKQFQVEQELERLEKLEKEEAAMREARVRIDAHNAERSSLASARNKEWQQRNSKAASRRKLESQRSDAELVRKQDEMQKRLDEEERHLQEVRASMASRRDAHIQSAQHAAAEQLVQMQQSVLGKIELKEQQILKHQQQKVEDLQEKRSKSPSGLTPEEARARKAELEQEFQAKARKETQLKASRSDGHVKAMSSTGFAKMKKLRKEKSASHLQRPSTQGRPLDDWDGELTKQPASEQPLEGSAGVSSPQKPLQGSQSTGFLPLLVQDQSRPASSVQPQQKEKGKEVFKAKQPFGATLHPAFTGTSQPSDAALRRVSVVSLSIDIGGDPLLQEMHERSGFWVKEAKRKKDQSFGKYC